MIFYLNEWQFREFNSSKGVIAILETEISLSLIPFMTKRR